jgi:predicted amidophosphoribosyltransferase
MRNCGFRDCNNQIKWKEHTCEKCYYRKENHKCDACLQSKDYNLVLQYCYNGTFRDFINDTEIMLERTRKMFAKIPSQLHHLLREMEKSLILTEEEKQAIVKKRKL